MATNIAKRQKSTLSGEAAVYKNEFGQIIGNPLPLWVPPTRDDLTKKEGLNGRTCRLELFDIEKHAQDLVSAFCKDDDRMWTYLSYGPIRTVEQLKQVMPRLMEANICYTIVDLQDGKAKGYFMLMRIDAGVGSLEIGNVVFSPDLQKTTIATEAFYLLLKLCFDSGYRRCEWKCDSLNLKSASAAERLGFQYEGTFRQATVYKQRNRDTNWFSILDSEWPALQIKFENWLSEDNFDENGKQRRRLEECGGIQ